MGESLAAVSEACSAAKKCIVVTQFAGDVQQTWNLKPNIEVGSQHSAFKHLAVIQSLCGQLECTQQPSPADQDSNVCSTALMLFYMLLWLCLGVVCLCRQLERQGRVPSGCELPAG